MVTVVSFCSTDVIRAVPHLDSDSRQWVCGSGEVKRRDVVLMCILSLSFSGNLLHVLPSYLCDLCSGLQILTQEDWNVVLYNGMASTSPWASLYFVALMTFGNYVLFNLLVAILVEGFQAEVSCHQGLIRRRDGGAKQAAFETLGWYWGGGLPK